jgi:hypothetical protein
MSVNVEAMVREGVAAVKAGKRDDARMMLTKAVELDPYNEEGWLWLSGVIDAPEDQRTCLENVLAINPANDKARKGLDYLVNGPPRPAAAPPPTAPPAAPAPPPPVPAPVNPFATPAFSAEPPVSATRSDSPFTSVEWDFTPPTATSSASAASRPVPEPSPQEYDDWVSGLQLRNTDPPTSKSSPFVGFEDDLFAAKPFVEEEPAEEEAPVFLPPARATSWPPPAPMSEPAAALPPARKIIADEPPVDVMVSSRWAPETEDNDRIGGGFLSRIAAVDPPAASPAKASSKEFEMSSDMFPSIPRSIKPTRLPGTYERASILLILFIGLLLVANITAAVLLISRLVTPA